MAVEKIFNFTKDKIEGKKWFEIIITLTVSLTAFNSGLLYCWPSPYIVKIVQDDRYDITEEQASYFTVFSQIGIIVLPPFLAPITSRFGRKKVILMTSVMYMISWILKALSTSLWLFYLARISAGFGDAITFSCSMVFIGEVTSPGVRGIWGNSLMLFGFLGQFAINVLGIYFSIQVTSIICILLPIFFVTVFSFMPESPYFYIAKGRYEEAKNSLRCLRREENVEEEFKELQIAVQNQLSGSGTWKELVTDKTNRRSLCTGIYLRMAQLFAGIYTFASYTLFIFNKSGTNIKPELATIIYTALNFVCYTLAVYGSNKLGRRKSLIISMILTGIVLSAEGVYFLIEKLFPEVNLESVQWFPLAGMIGFLLSSSFGVGVVPSLMLGEIFSVSNKSKCTAIVTSVFGIMGLILNNIFYYLNSYTGLCGPFLMFGICNFVSAIITYYIIPETKNKTLEQIQEQLRKM